jgi:hypothetical protein
MPQACSPLAGPRRSAAAQPAPERRPTGRLRSCSPDSATSRMPEAAYGVTVSCGYRPGRAAWLLGPIGP